MTLHAPAKPRTLPSVFPVKKARCGARSAVSIADKIALFDYAYWHRLTQAETARCAGISPGTIASWKRQVLQEKGRSANKIDQRALALVVPTGPSTPTGQDSDANKTPSPTGPATRLPEAPKHPSVWAHEEKLALMHRMVAESLSNKQAAVIVGTTTVIITAWRRELGFAGRRCAPAELSDEEKIILLEMQKTDGLSNIEVAEVAGVRPDTISIWRRTFGYPGRRGDGPRRYTEAQKRETLARIDAGEITVSDAAAEFGTTPNAIYGWRQASRSSTRQRRQARRCAR